MKGNILQVLPEVYGMGRSIFDPIWAQKEHRDPQSELLHVLRGSVTVQTRTYSITGREGDTIYTPAGTYHRDVFPDQSVFEVYLVQFAWAGEKRMLRKFSPARLTKVSKSGRIQLAADFHQLYQEFKSDLPFGRELVNLRLLHILGRMCQEAATAGPSGRRARPDSSKARRMQIMTLARQIIRDKFAAPLTLETIAESLDLSPYYLSRVFSEESGFTLSSYLTQVRMEHAAELLLDPRRSVKQVAAAAGFRDSHYFRRVFKSYYRKSPKEYRTGLRPPA